MPKPIEIGTSLSMVWPATVTTDIISASIDKIPGSLTCDDLRYRSVQLKCNKQIDFLCSIITCSETTHWS